MNIKIDSSNWFDCGDQWHKNTPNKKQKLLSNDKFYYLMVAYANEKGKEVIAGTPFVHLAGLSADDLDSQEKN